MPFCNWHKSIPGKSIYYDIGFIFRLGCKLKTSFGDSSAQTFRKTLFRKSCRKSFWCRNEPFADVGLGGASRGRPTRRTCRGTSSRWSGRPCGSSARTRSKTFCRILNIGDVVETSQSLDASSADVVSGWPSGNGFIKLFAATIDSALNKFFKCAKPGHFLLIFVLFSIQWHVKHKIWLYFSIDCVHGIRTSDCRMESYSGPDIVPQVLSRFWGASTNQQGWLFPGFAPMHALHG